MRHAALSALIVSAVVKASSEVAKPTFTPTSIKGPLVEQFTDDWQDRWSPSAATKKTPVGTDTFSYVGQWSVEESSVYHAMHGDKGLVAKTKASHHAISTPFEPPVDPKGKSLVIQYEVKFQKGGNCGGGYVKLLEEGYKSKEFSNDTPWVIMFGPDLTCPGTKVHFIFRHQNPISKEWEEKHFSNPPMPIINEMTKLYTLIVNPDNTFEILLDDKSVSKGNLLEDFTPSVNPPKEIDDVDDVKPEDWVDEEKIRDPDARKPDDWDESQPFQILDEDAVKPEGWLDDEPLEVADPEASKPEEWDDEEDGDWVPPVIRNPKCDEAPGCGEWKRPTKPNPKYVGIWSAPLIDNPAYKGPWAPRKVPNPNYFEDHHPANLNKIGGVGFEIWSMTEDILFDNIYVGHSVEDAKALAAETFHKKHAVEQAQKDEEEAKKKAELDAQMKENEAKDTVTEKLKTAMESLKENPVEFLRETVLDFFEALKQDPKGAFQSQPYVGAAIVAAFLTLFGAIGALFGVVGSSGKPVSKSTKKTDAATPDDKKAAADKTPSAPAGDKKATNESSVRQRK